MELPKVNIAVIGVICSSLGGFVWYASEQASIISNLEETVSVLDAKSNTTEKINMIRDISYLFSSYFLTEIDQVIERHYIIGSK